MASLQGNPPRCAGNPKSEIRNPKETENRKTRNPKRSRKVLNLGIQIFCFFRISDFGFPAQRVRTLFGFNSSGSDTASVRGWGWGSGGFGCRRLLRVVVHLRQQVVGDVADIHRDADETITEESVEEDSGHRERDADQRDAQGVRDAVGQVRRVGCAAAAQFHEAKSCPKPCRPDRAWVQGYRWWPGR